MLENIPRKQRKLSYFLCQEMLYDYYLGLLDEDRTKAVGEFLNENSEVKNELRLIGLASHYCKQMSSTKISAAYLSELRAVKPFANKFVHKFKWSEWPEVVKWMVEALALSFVVVAVAVFTPWRSIQELLPKKEKAVVQSPAPIIIETPPSEKSEELPVETKVADTKSEETQPAEKPAQVPRPAPAPVPSPAVVVTTTTTTVPTQPSAADATQPARPMGLLYNIEFDMVYDPAKVEQIKTLLANFNAKKAGQVSLGWRKTNPPGSYFHFTMEEKYLDQLTTTLGGYGPVQIHKNSHPRVMPQGQIRIILWIEDTAPPATSTPNSAPVPADDGAQKTGL